MCVIIRYFTGVIVTKFTYICLFFYIFCKMDEAEEIPPTHEEEPAPVKRGRGRPPGSKNRVRISVVPPETREPPEEPEEVQPQEPVAMKTRAPRAKKEPAAAREAPPHDAFKHAMTAWQAMVQLLAS